MLNDGKIFTVIYSNQIIHDCHCRRPLSKSPRPLALIHYVPCCTSVSVTIKSQSVDVDSKTRINKKTWSGAVVYGPVRSGAVISQTEQDWACNVHTAEHYKVKPTQYTTHNMHLNANRHSFICLLK